MCTAMNVSKLGCTHLIKMDIQEKPGSSIPYSRPYKASATQRAIINEKVSEWKSAGIFTETSSSYASPCLLVTKADGTSRLVVDYRGLDKSTVRINFPLHNVDDAIEDLHDAVVFATLD